MSAAPVIIIITKPPKKNARQDQPADDSREIHLIGHENSTDYEILLAAAAQLENE